MLEPYSRPYYYGPERQSRRYESEPIHDEFTFDATRNEIEAPYEGEL